MSETNTETPATGTAQVKPLLGDLLANVAAMASAPLLMVEEGHQMQVAMRHKGERQALTDQDREEFQRADNAKQTGGYGYVVDSSGVAIFSIQGLITPLQYAYGYGGETITEWMILDLVAAASDPNVRAGLFLTNSPGGYVDGAYELADAIAAFAAQKMTAGHVSGYGASAAYLQLIQTNHITAYKTALVGSIGTRSVAVDAEAYFRMFGVKVIPIDSGGMKSAGLIGTPITEGQIAYFKDKTMKLNALFLDEVAAKRRFDRQTVERIGDGRVHVAADAKELRLIDAVGTVQQAHQQLLDRVTSRIKTTSPGSRQDVPTQSHPASEPEQKTEQEAEAAAGDVPPGDGADAQQPGNETPEKGSAMAGQSTPAPANQAAEPKPATIAELQKEFAEDPAFALDAAGKALTLLEAKAAYADKLKAENKQLKDAAAKKQEETAPKGSAGVKPVESTDRKPAGQKFEGDAIEQFDAAVTEQMTKPGYANRKKAVAAVMKRDPELHRAYLEQTNSSRKARDLIADKFDNAA